MKKITKILLIGFIFLSYSCDRKRDIDFNSQMWKIEKDLKKFPYRDLMIANIIENNRFIGYQYGRLIDSLGIPVNIKSRNKNDIYYLIENDYGWDIDPVYSKYLIFTLNRDSVVTKTIIYEWKK